MLSKNHIRQIASLGMKKFREERQEFIAEGHKLVMDIASGNLKIKSLYCLESWHAEYHALLAGKQFTCEVISSREMDRISQLTTPGPVLAVVHIPGLPEAPPLSMPEGETIILALDDIRDPGNFGTIIRIADWFGIHHVVASENCVDLYNPKTVQATMGSVARVKVYSANLSRWLQQRRDSGNPMVYGAILDGEPVYSVSPFVPGILIIGNESRGISADLYPFITKKISIPSYGPPEAGKAESLNASTATAILAAELRRIENPSPGPSPSRGGVGEGS
jgi:TrmH family RNA methyltransferase